MDQPRPAAVRRRARRHVVLRSHVEILNLLGPAAGPEGAGAARDEMAQLRRRLDDNYEAGGLDRRNDREIRRLRRRGPAA